MVECGDGQKDEAGEGQRKRRVAEGEQLANNAGALTEETPHARS
ncbi:hypothetical protein GCM10012275_47770 [Longimycelium tulufanense]|uniref:Uncharacterized protein n=1 Tax=Longimycelium tulufanense TaxID=907463 RepID=A0A8J3CHW0_9PSEU|nr:hypothetical protein GCM10012275_47770 [Longimycelium tulufanense]